MVDVAHDAAHLAALGQQRRIERIDGVEEGTAVEAAGHRVAGGEAVQRLVLAADLVLRGLELGERHQQLVVDAVQDGDVGEVHQAAPQPPLPVLDRRAADDGAQGFVLAGAGDLDGLAAQGAAGGHRPHPREIVGRAVKAADQPPQRVGRGAGGQLTGVRMKTAEGVVGQHHPPFLVQHHHALGEGVKGRAHPVGHHLGRVEVFEHPAQIQVKRAEGERADQRQHHEGRVGQPFDEGFGQHRPKHQLDLAPGPAFGEHRHPHLGERGRAVLRRMPVLRVVAHLHEHHAAALADGHRAQVVVALQHFAQGALKRRHVAGLQLGRGLHGQALAELLAHLAGNLRAVREQTEHQVDRHQQRDQQPHQPQRDARHRAEPEKMQSHGCAPVLVSNTSAIPISSCAA